ncbi:MAG: HlyD family efflux transporter periplasmic adaptor subunit [Pseudomonadales bacterium]
MAKTRCYTRISTFAEQWLNFFVRSLPGIVQAQVFLGEPEENDYQLLSIWPQMAEFDPAIGDFINQCIEEKQPVFLSHAINPHTIDQGPSTANQTKVLQLANIQSYLLAVPLVVEQQLYGSLGVHIRTEALEIPKKLLIPLLQAAKWLDLFCTPDSLDSGDNNVAKSTGTLLEATAISLSHNSLHDAATALATELASQLCCERVTVGLINTAKKGQRSVYIEGLSHSAHFSAKQTLVKDLATLIEEAVDQDRTIVQPPTTPTDRASQLVYARYSREHGNNRLCTVPLTYNNTITGGMVFERPHSASAFSDQDVLLYQQIAALISPIFVYRERNQRGLVQQCINLLREQTAKIVGTGYLTWKLSAGLGLLIVMFFTFVQSTYRVAANASLEGRIERLISAPEDGFIKTVTIRPGDKVGAGQLLATLDDRDLILEQQKWNSKLQQTAKEYRGAMASHDTSRIGILRAQRNQVQAQLDLTNSKLSRLSITSPLAGIVISGDLSQSLGSPVNQGDKLFTIAPLEDYRVHLKIDEADIAQLQAGQTGTLFLRAAVDKPLVFTVEKITPIAIAENDINYFRVDALLNHPPLYLRPGMQGVGKIEVGKRRLIWIWTHDLTEWLRLKFWSWW